MISPIAKPERSKSLEITQVGNLPSSNVANAVSFSPPGYLAQPIFMFIFQVVVPPPTAEQDSLQWVLQADVNKTTKDSFEKLWADARRMEDEIESLKWLARRKEMEWDW